MAIDKDNLIRLHLRRMQEIVSSEEGRSLLHRLSLKRHRMVDNIVVVLDLDGVKYHKLTNPVMEYIFSIAEAGSILFPGLLHRMYVLNVPSIWKTFVRHLNKLVPKPLIKRLVLLGGPDEYEARLREDLGENTVPAQYGGKAEFPEGLWETSRGHKALIPARKPLEVSIPFHQGQLIQLKWFTRKGFLRTRVYFKPNPQPVPRWTFDSISDSSEGEEEFLECEGGGGGESKVGSVTGSTPNTSRTDKDDASESGSLRRSRSARPSRSSRANSAKSTSRSRSSRSVRKSRGLRDGADESKGVEPLQSSTSRVGSRAPSAASSRDPTIYESKTAAIDSDEDMPGPGSGPGPGPGPVDTSKPSGSNPRSASRGRAMTSPKSSRTASPKSAHASRKNSPKSSRTASRTGRTGRTGRTASPKSGRTASPKSGRTASPKSGRSDRSVSPKRSNLASPKAAPTPVGDRPSSAKGSRPSSAKGSRPSSAKSRPSSAKSRPSSAEGEEKEGAESKEHVAERKGSDTVFGLEMDDTVAVDDDFVLSPRKAVTDSLDSPAAAAAGEKKEPPVTAPKRPMRMIRPDTFHNPYRKQRPDAVLGEVVDGNREHYKCDKECVFNLLSDETVQFVCGKTMDGVFTIRYDNQGGWEQRELFYRWDVLEDGDAEIHVAREKRLLLRRERRRARLERKAMYEEHIHANKHSKYLFRQEKLALRRQREAEAAERKAREDAIERAKEAKFREQMAEHDLDAGGEPDSEGDGTDSISDTELGGAGPPQFDADESMRRDEDGVIHIG